METSGCGSTRHSSWGERGRWGFWIPWIYPCVPCMHRYLNLWWDWVVSATLNFEFLVVATLCPCAFVDSNTVTSHLPFSAAVCIQHVPWGLHLYTAKQGQICSISPIAVALTTSEFQHLPTQISLGLGPNPFNLSRVFQHRHSPKVFEHRCHRCRHGVAGCWRPPAREASSGWRSTSWADAGRDVGAQVFEATQQDDST